MRNCRRLPFVTWWLIMNQFSNHGDHHHIMWFTLRRSHWDPWLIPFLGGHAPKHERISLTTGKLPEARWSSLDYFSWKDMRQDVRLNSKISVSFHDIGFSKDFSPFHDSLVLQHSCGRFQPQSKKVHFDYIQSQTQMRSPTVGQKSKLAVGYHHL